MGALFLFLKEVRSKPSIASCLSNFLSLMNEQTENLQELPAKQTKSSPFYLLLLGAPIGFVLAVLGVIFVNAVLPSADAERFKSLIFSGFGGGGTGASLIGGVALMGRSLLMTGGKIANNTPSQAPDLSALVGQLAVNALSQSKSSEELDNDGEGPQDDEAI